MSVLDNAKEHFKEQLANGLQEIDVPEWKTKVFVQANQRNIKLRNLRKENLLKH